MLNVGSYVRAMIRMLGEGGSPERPAGKKVLGFDLKNKTKKKPLRKS